MHATAYHLPKLLEAYKTVKLFSGQGLEKNNDVARSVVLKKSNNRNAAADVLKLESRQWDLKEKERKKRGYEKENYTCHDLGVADFCWEFCWAQQPNGSKAK